jgi:hypothetical protein
LWDLFVYEGGGSRDSCLGGGEFELLVEISTSLSSTVIGVLGTMRKG